MTYVTIHKLFLAITGHIVNVIFIKFWLLIQDEAEIKI